MTPAPSQTRSMRGCQRHEPVPAILLSVRPEIRSHRRRETPRCAVTVRWPLLQRPAKNDCAVPRHPSRAMQGHRRLRMTLRGSRSLSSGRRSRTRCLAPQDNGFRAMSRAQPIVRPGSNVAAPSARRQRSGFRPPAFQRCEAGVSSPSPDRSSGILRSLDWCARNRRDGRRPSPGW